MGTYVIAFNNRFPTPMMVYLSINEMELVVRLIINKNEWHGIFEQTHLVKSFIFCMLNVILQPGEVAVHAYNGDGGADRGRIGRREMASGP